MGERGTALVILWVLWSSWPALGWSPGLAEYVTTRHSVPAPQRHIATVVRQQAAVLRQHGVAALQARAGGVGRVSVAGDLDVFVYTTSLEAAALTALAQAGVQRYGTLPATGVVYGALSAAALETVAALPFVRWIGPPVQSALRVGSVTTAGDAAVQAAEARTMFGIDGSGVRVGVISDSLTNLQLSVATGDLPPDLLIVNGEDGSTIGSPTDEGRAIAELIYDLAPGATLLFHSGFPTSANMVQAINALVMAGADILVDDIGFLGEPVFEHGAVAQAVQAAIDQGVVYVSSAGNAADNHYRATFREADPNDGDPAVNLHDFGGGDVTMAISLAPSESLLAILHWANPADGSGRDDYDLLVFDAAGTLDACLQPGISGLCSSTDDQANTAAPPIELVIVQNNTFSAATVTLLINRVAGAAVPLAINFNLGHASQLLEHNVAAGSVFGHPCVRAALAVGAIAVTPDFLTNPIEFFSAHGPCELRIPAQDVITKPDLAGPDGVATTLSLFSPFFGTSASAPHVAALAALLIDAAGGPGVLSGPQVANMLRLAAVDRGPPPHDQIFGHGAADGVAAVQRVLAFLAGGNTAPQSTIDAPPPQTAVALGTPVWVQGACADAEDNGPLTGQWDFGGALPATAALIPGALVFPALGVVPLTFTCTDGAGLADATPATRTLTVSRPPASTIVSPTGPLTVGVGSRLNFTGTCSDPDNNQPFSFRWTFGGGATLASSTQQNPSGVLFDTLGTFTVTFTCTDALGLPDPIPVTVLVQVVAQVSSGGGGCNALEGATGMARPPLSALGNLLLPLLLLLGLRRAAGLVRRR